MPITESRRRATRKYLDKTDEVKLRYNKEIFPGMVAEWKAAAEARGQSMPEFVRECVETALERSRTKKKADAEE